MLFLPWTCLGKDRKKSEKNNNVFQLIKNCVRKNLTHKPVQCLLLHTKLKKEHPWLDARFWNRVNLFTEHKYLTLLYQQWAQFSATYKHSQTINSTSMNVGCWRHQKCDKPFWSLEGPHPFWKLTKPHTLLKDTLLFRGNSFFKAKKTPLTYVSFFFSSLFVLSISIHAQVFCKELTASKWNFSSFVSILANSVILPSVYQYKIFICEMQNRQVQKKLRFLI